MTELTKQTLRYPAVPLIAADPNFSVWSFSDHLAADDTRHWTGARQPLVGFITVDAVKACFCGRQVVCNIARQLSVRVDPVTTTYTFEFRGVALKVRFITPLLPDDLDLLGRPASFIECQCWSLDGSPHTVSIEFGVSALLAVDTSDQQVLAEQVTHANGLTTLRAGTLSQAVLNRSGDDLRIDWGHVHLFAPDQPDFDRLALVKEWELKLAKQMEPYPEVADAECAARDAPMLAIRFHRHIPAGSAARANEPAADGLSARVIVAYDDAGAALEVFGRRTPGYWARSGKTFDAMLAEVAHGYEGVVARCEAFDRRMNAAAIDRGGEEYRDILALAYRQSVAAHKLVADPEGAVEFHSKECLSNGCMTTVDVSCPSMPLFLLVNPELVRGMMRPVLRYARSPEWTFDYAPHDIGQFPIADGQRYARIDQAKPGVFREDHQMPVEECGNMLVMLAAEALFSQSVEFALTHWDLVEKWAHYLIKFGVDPGEQLCTDDFCGPLAHNANLAIKAVIAVGGYAWLCGQTGRDNEAESAWNAARSMADQWQVLARDPQGHFRLAYDQPGSWSLKYNLLWDAVLGLNLFPGAVVDTEMASYIPRFLPYGIPLDNRSTFTKTDSMLACAALEADRDGFDRWTHSLWRMLNETPHRVPFTDWFYADTAAQAWFQNRSVQGGLFAPLLKHSCGGQLPEKLR